MHHQQAGFISRMHSWFNIQKSMYSTIFTELKEKKKHIMISSDAEKACNKIQ